MDEFKELVLDRLYMLHANAFGNNLIKKNIGLEDDTDTVEWCKKQLRKKSVKAKLNGKNWHVSNKKYELIITSSTLTIISAKRIDK